MRVNWRKGVEKRGKTKFRPGEGGGGAFKGKI